MRLEYNDIIFSIALNLGIDSPNNKQSSIIKRDIYMTLLKIMRKATPVKRTMEESITTSKQEILLPEDFFTAHEVVFKSESGASYFSEELEIERYARWSPTVDLTEMNFEVQALSSIPAETLWTKENTELDGRIGYYFTDQEDISRLVWKPAIVGSVTIVYSSITDEQFEEVLSVPDIHYSFRELLILGPTIQGLLRKPSKTELEMNDKVLQLRMYQDEFKIMLKEFAGYINRRTNTIRINPFDFANDINQIILG